MVKNTKLILNSTQFTDPSIRRNCKNLMRQQAKVYCEKTSLHGLRYVGDTSLSLGERTFWLVAFIGAIGFAAYYINNIYQKWYLNPVIISFSPFDASLTTIPFPAVTICNMNQAKRSAAREIINRGRPVDRKLLGDLCHGEHNTMATDGDSDYAPNWTTIRSFLLNVSQSCRDIIKACYWQSRPVSCEDFFNNDLTDEGLCCSFNRLPPKYIFKNANDVTLLNQTYSEFVYDWSPEQGFATNRNQKFNPNESWIPRRPLGAGTHLGLTVLLDSDAENYYCSSTDSVGFKFLLSNPIETPKMADFGYLLGTGTENRVEINPIIREASDALRGISIAARQCYFSNERPLQYYRTYTQRNCKLECQSNYTLKMCGCISYFLPRNKDIKVCGKSNEICSIKAKEDMELTFGNGTSCKCLPSCFELNFAQTTSFSFLSKQLIPKQSIGKNISKDYFLKNMAVVHFFFQETKFRKQIKSELYGFTEVLSNVGGLLGLCLGFSFLSFIEVIYFLTIKIICSILYSNRHNLNGEKSAVFPFVN